MTQVPMVHHTKQDVTILLKIHVYYKTSKMELMSNINGIYCEIQKTICNNSCIWHLTELL